MAATMRRFAKWFLVSGGIGVLVVTALYALAAIPIVQTNEVFNPYAILVLAPAMILGMAEPTAPGDIAQLLVIVFSTNFALYGLLGLLLCGVSFLFRRARQSRIAGSPTGPE